MGLFLFGSLCFVVGVMVGFRVMERIHDGEWGE